RQGERGEAEARVRFLHRRPAEIVALREVVCLAPPGKVIPALEVLAHGRPRSQRRPAAPDAAGGWGGRLGTGYRTGCVVGSAPGEGGTRRAACYAPSARPAWRAGRHPGRLRDKEVARGCSLPDALGPPRRQG